MAGTEEQAFDGRDRRYSRESSPSGAAIGGGRRSGPRQKGAPLSGTTIRIDRDQRRRFTAYSFRG